MEYGDEAAAAAAVVSYDDFIKRHRLQLESIPDNLCPVLYSKLKNEILDAGTYFSLQESNGLRGGHDLIATPAEGIAQQSDLFLTDHFFMFMPTKDMQAELASNLKLLERLEAMMGLSAFGSELNDNDDQPDDAEDLVLLVSTAATCSEDAARNALQSHNWEVVEAMSSLEQTDLDDMHNLQQQIAQQLGGDRQDQEHAPKKLEVRDRASRAFNEIWKIAQTYSVAWEAEDSTVKVQTVWFVCDEVGTSISHSETPNSKMTTFLYYPKLESTAPIAYSLFWPILDLEYGDLLTRDFVPEMIRNGFSRDAYRIALDIYPKADLKGAKQRLHSELLKYKSDVGGSKTLKPLESALKSKPVHMPATLTAKAENRLLDFGLLADFIHRAYEANPAWFPLVYDLESQLHLLVAEYFDRSGLAKNWWTVRGSTNLDGYSFTTGALARIARQVDLGGSIVVVEWPQDELEEYGGNPFNMFFNFVVVEHHGSLSALLNTEDFIVRIAQPHLQHYSDHPAHEPTPTLVLDTPSTFIKNFSERRLEMIIDEVAEAVGGLIKAIYLDQDVSPNASACGFFQMQIRIKKGNGIVVEGLRNGIAMDWAGWRIVPIDHSRPVTIKKYNYFVYKVPIGKKSKKNCKTEQIKNIYTRSTLEELGHPSRPCTFAPLIQKLKTIFPDGGTVFVIDGDPTSAKSETSMKRHREWGKVVDELDKVAASMKQAADDGKKRMPKSFYEMLDRLTRRAFLVNDDVKTGLAAALEAEFKVEKAPGEADVYIGRVATDLDIVVSGDSEVFCYRNVKTMVRPTRHRGQSVFNVLDKSLALRKMRLHADDLVVLAVVSGNDYASNIPGKAIVTNVKVFQKIKEKGDFSKEEMLKKYLQPPVQVFYNINSHQYRFILEFAKALFNIYPQAPDRSIVPHTSFGDRYMTMFSSKGRLLDEVFRLPPEILAKSRYVLDDSPRRYVRTPSFMTNGLVLSLLWIDTTSKPSPPDRKVEDAINLSNIFSNKSLQSTH
ncbi:hypothetical protein SeLEV6574_g01380 [Synchytrium endobioticum]|uniref:Tubulin--tyrosine ligase-like protein 12 SET-like domain-containing protein n=1 Tax=Synchytrium endobioticum TaxID=286115 RepID=A0A507DDU8_9FUNG|nr:hypothetical protein SeLEV6574_g01380 [Synchytrium endobioticum]